MSPTTTGTLGHLRELNGGLVGASTGFMWSLRGDWRAQLHAARRFSSQVVELSALAAPEMPGLVEFLDDQQELSFEHVMVHGPAKHLAERPDEVLREQLLELPAFVEGVVVHPETLTHPETLEEAGGRLILENMDDRKHDARTVAELERFFAVLPNARFCFDVAHAQLNDPSLRLAHELLDAFGGRLAEVHLSSILPSGRHVPLECDDLVSFEPVLTRCVGVPWILEAPVSD